MGQGNGGRAVTLKGLMPSTKGKGGKLRWYVRRKGLPLVAMPDLPHDDPRFLAAYAAAWAVKAPEKPQETAQGTIAAHVRDALSSARYKAASPAYRAALRRHVDDIARAYGTLPVAGLRDRHIAADVDKATQPLMRLKAWRFLCKPMRPDPSRAVNVERPKTDGHAPWSADDLAAFRARWPIGSAPRAAMEVLFWTGARISDAVKIGPGNVGADGVLAFRQTKTRGMAYVPWTCPLPDYAADMQPDRATMFAAIAPFAGHMTFLATAQGRGRSSKALGVMISDACAKAGVDKSAHGLRKARAQMLAEAGATTHQIAAWTGHETLQEVAHYTAAADRRRAVIGAIPSARGTQSREK